MPPIVFVVAAGVAAYAGYRWFNSQLASSDAAARRSEDRSEDRKSPASEGTDGTSQHAKDLGTLEWDEAAGAYRPKRMN